MVRDAKKTVTIVVVESDKSVLDMVSAILQQVLGVDEGLEVSLHFLHNGSRLQAFIKEHKDKINVVIMGGWANGGGKAYIELRKDPESSKIPVVAFSGSFTDEDVKNAKKETGDPFVEFVAKGSPKVVQDLLAAVKKLLEL